MAGDVTVSLARAQAAGALPAGGRSPAGWPRASLRVGFVLLAFAAFGLYWLSALVLQARGKVNLFGTDQVLYASLAGSNVAERIGKDYAVDRITRFHPLTTGLAVAWMKALHPLTPWIAPRQLLKGLFAAVGGIGVWAALWAFAAVVPRRQAMLWGAVYASSLGVWYFSSIEESKVVAATLTALYIAAWLHLRKRWTLPGAAVLTAILLCACLNEIIAGFLVVIPVVDTLMTRGRSMHRLLRHGRWIALHALVVPAVLVFLELVVNRRLVGVTVAGPGSELEGTSHLGMLVYYVTRHDFALSTLYAFLVNWLFFSVAAPTVLTTLAPAEWPAYTGYFAPAVANYLASPVSAGVVALFGVMVLAGLLPKRGSPAGGDGGLAAVLAALLVYAVLRGGFWFVVNPFECVLFSPPATLAHLLLVAVPFAASRLPAKRGILAAFALLLFVTNGTFIIGR
jgi:hypothetical protein